MLTFSSGFFSVTIINVFKTEVNACDKWSVSGSGKWKFGGKIMWTLENQGVKMVESGNLVVNIFL